MNSVMKVVQDDVEEFLGWYRGCVERHGQEATDMAIQIILSGYPDLFKEEVTKELKKRAE